MKLVRPTLDDAAQVALEEAMRSPGKRLMVVTTDNGSAAVVDREGYEGRLMVTEFEIYRPRTRPGGDGEQ